MEKTAIEHPVLVVMGVSGSGKSTVAGFLAGALGWELAEGDDFHPAANVAKMAAGHPLTDEDRWPWLDTIAGWIKDRDKLGEPGVVTCSAGGHESWPPGQVVVGHDLGEPPVGDQRRDHRGGGLVVVLHGEESARGQRVGDDRDHRGDHVHPGVAREDGLGRIVADLG